MRRILAAALLAAAPAASAAVAWRTERVETRNAAAPVVVRVATPPSYETSPARTYPVLYFLHDGGGDEGVLFRQGIADALESAMRAGSLPEMVVVAPRGVGTWWVDAHGSGTRMSSFLSNDLVPWVERSYRVRKDRGGRLVAGISMGGYGAFRWALARPDLFAAAGALSPAIQPMSWRAYLELPFFIRPSFAASFGADPLSNGLAANDLYQILLDDPGLAARAPVFLVRVGTEDKYRLGEIVGFFDRFASAVGLAHEVVLETGVHDWPYWRRVMPDLVRDLAARLVPEGRP